jgi:pilus assembly protein Flp/PilA
MSRTALRIWLITRYQQEREARTIEVSRGTTTGTINLGVKMLRQYILFENFIARRRQALVDRRGERGATAVEYGLMVALIAVVIIAAVTLLGKNLTAKFNSVAGSIGS